MSNLANKTELKALKVLANTLRFFQETANLNMTATDAFQVREAENLIKGIIENNDFSANYKKGKGTRLTKFKNQVL
ncbi:MAG: hypothetical protein M3N14_03645 [Bacteroidota bacterium]|nr:hypothetical protein [Bacteroidota bacterium]